MEKPHLEYRFGTWEVQPIDTESDTIVNVCADQFVVVDKIFGPQCSSRIRVRHDLKECAWVVEEENFNNSTWIERCRFDAQEFYKDKYKTGD